MPNTIPHLKHSLCQVCNSVLALHREYAKNEDGTRDLSEKTKQKSFRVPKIFTLQASV